MVCCILLVSADMQRGSLSGAVSYDAPSVSSVAGSNGVTSGSISVTAVGVGFVSYGVSSRVLFGGSAALSTVWISGSSVVARCGAGLGGGVSVAVSFGVQAGGLSLALSYNAATVSSVSLLEVAVSGASLVDIFGLWSLPFFETDLSTIGIIFFCETVTLSSAKIGCE